MFKIILLGWVGGIALMGIDFPLIMQYEKVGEALLLLAFIFYLYLLVYTYIDFFRYTNTMQSRMLLVMFIQE